MRTPCCAFAAPLLSRKSRFRRTMVSPCQCMVSVASAVTVATWLAVRFSAAASACIAAWSSAAMTTAMRSCDSLMASSVPERPWYLTGTASRLMSRPSASSPIATATPPAPKSLQRLMRRENSGFLNRRCSLRSSGGLPFCTSAADSCSEPPCCAREEPVAPPQPSRPVAPPMSRTRSPAAGSSRRTFSAGTAATTAPTSMCFALKPSW